MGWYIAGKSGNICILCNKSIRKGGKFVFIGMDRGDSADGKPHNLDTAHFDCYLEQFEKPEREGK